MTGAAGRHAGRIAALFRHPVKGFTPERLDGARLASGAAFPGDRLYAVERGDSGFDPTTPRHVSKQRFAVLANHPGLARIDTSYDDATATLRVTGGSGATFAADLSSEAGRSAFAAYVQDLLGEDEPQPLRVLAAPGGFRFTDHPEGFVSLLNLASVEELEREVGRRIDPLRFRANIHIRGWPAWCELGLRAGMRLRVDGATAAVIQPITRCVATHVDPASGERDIDVLGELRRHYAHQLCGIYLRVLEGGAVRVGEPASLLASPEQAA